MNNFDYFVFFKNETGQIDSEILKNTTGSELVIDVYSSGGFTLLVQGLLSPNSTNWQNLSTINISTLSVQNKITSSGIYAININGINRIKCSIELNASSLDVSGKVTL